jgi:type IV secretion system protein VirB11
MNNLPKYYKSTPYYRFLIKEYINELIKRAEYLEISNLDGPINHLEEQGYDLTDDERTLLKDWLSNLLNFKFLLSLIHDYVDDTIEEVIIHSNSWIQIIGNKRKEFFQIFLDNEDYQFALETLCIRNGILWNRSQPFQSFQANLFKSDWRVTAVHHSLCGDNPSKVFFRAQGKKTFNLESFSLTSGQITLLKECLEKKKNILVCGATGSGKTTFLKALIEEVPQREHIITLEDTSELRPSSPFATQLIATNHQEEQLKNFCHYALRMRPDRLVLGEIRSSEVVPFLLSINTGHGGMMASLHANSALDALHRLCLLFQVYSGQMNISYHDVLKLVCQGIDFILHLENKKVVNILEVKGCEGMTPYYELWN